MVRLAARTVINLLANAVGLILGAVILDKMTMNATGFVVALLIFTGVEMLVTPMIRQMALKQAQVLMGSTALVATFVSLIVTKILGSGLEISGLSTWVLATVIVWVGSLAGQLLLPLIIFKKALAERRD